MSLVWAFTLILLVAAGAAAAVSESLGVNWGALTSHPLHPSIVVNLLKDNGIKKVKLFDADPWVVSHFAGTGIELMLGIPNDQLDTFAHHHNAAKDWVKENVTKQIRHGGVDIKYVAVGNEPFLESYNGAFTKNTFPALQNVQNALHDAGLGDKIKVTIPFNADVYQSASDTPSKGSFRRDIKGIMTDIVRFYKENNCPFTVNIYPFISLYQNSHFPKEFAFFDGNRTVTDMDLRYSNAFDANYDTLVWALTDVKTPDLKIIVGEIGWPTDGNMFANKDNAKKFYDGLLKRLATGKGTPLRRGQKMDVYLFGLFDEDMKSTEPGFFERHWGIFTFDGKPKFPMDLSGGGNKKLVGAKGVKYLDRQWCVYDKSAGSQYMLPTQIDWACGHADCSALTNGSSCSNTDEYLRTSYAFNSYFQTNDQDVESCDFQGLAKIVKDDPSKGNCEFHIQIESAGQRLTISLIGTIAALLVSFVTFFITLV